MNSAEEFEILSRECQQLEKEANDYEIVITELNNELERKQREFEDSMAACTADSLKHLKVEAETYVEEIQSLKMTRQQLIEENEILNEKLKLHSEEESVVDHDDSFVSITTKIDELEDELKLLNSEMEAKDKINTDLLNEISELDQINESASVRVKYLNDALIEKDKEIDELEREVNALKEEVEFDCENLVPCADTKSLFSEVEENRAVSLDLFNQLKKSYLDLKSQRQIYKLKVVKMEQTKKLFDSNLNQCKDDYSKYLHNALTTLKYINHQMSCELDKLKWVYDQKKGKDISDTANPPQSYLNGLIAVTSKTYAQMREEIFEKNIKRVLLIENGLQLMQKIFQIQRELLSEQNKNVYENSC